ncbi:MAG: serpin family protein [Akkermansia sp.]
MIKKLRFIIFMVLLGLALGIAGRSVNSDFVKSWFDWETKPPIIEIPEGGVKSDEWSLLSFKLMAELQPDGFVFSPLGLNITLRDLQSIADEPTSKLIDSMHLPSIEGAEDRTSPAVGFSRLIVDNQIDCQQEASVLKLPLSSDRAKAFKSLHMQMVQSIETSFDYPISNAMISRDAKLVGFTLIEQDLDWFYPAAHESGSYIEFQTAKGSTQMLDALTLQARCMHADLYDAYAITLKGEVESSKVSCLLLIMPKFDPLPDFIKRLDSKELNRIKESLIQCEPSSEINLKLPIFQSIGQTTSMRPLLTKMGLAHLFESDVIFPQLCEQPLNLEELWHSANFKVQASDKSLLPFKSKAEARAVKEIDRPFIWMVGDLNSSECPSLMGSVPIL